MNRFVLPSLLVLLCFSMSAARGQTQPVTAVADVLRLDSTVVARSVFSVKLRGVVVNVGATGNHFHLHDGVASVLIAPAAGIAAPRVGQAVEVEGRAATYVRGGRTHIWVAASAVAAGETKPLPKAKPISLNTLNNFTEWDQWVSVEGYVFEWRYRQGTLALKLVTRENWSTVTIAVPDASAIPPNLQGAQLRLTGVNNGDHTQFDTMQMTSLEQMEVLVPGTTDIFDAPLVSIAEVNKRQVEAGRRVRVRGTLAATMEERKFIIQGEGGALLSYMLQSRNTEEPGAIYGDAGAWPVVQPGDVVELVGSVVDQSSLMRSYGLSWCYVRVVGKGTIPKPESVKLQQMLDYRDGDHWVTFEATISAWMYQGTSMMYAVTDPNSLAIFGVRDSPVPNPFPKNLYGARARFTGIANSLSLNFYGCSFIVPNPSFVEILKPGRTDSFDVKEYSAADIANDRFPPGEQVKTKGVLVGRDGNALYIRGGDAAICVAIQLPWNRPANTAGMFFADCGPVPDLKIGDILEVMGTPVRLPPGTSFTSYDLSSTNVRVLGHQDKVEPGITTLTRIAEGKHTNDLVQVRGRLLTIQVASLGGGQWRTTMLLKADGQRMTAVHQSAVLHPFDTLKTDDDILIQAVVDRATAQSPRQLRLLSPTDAKSLGPSPEIITRRLWIWGGLAVLVFGILGGWVLLLRHSHRRQAQVTAELKAANDAARESEQRWKLLFEQSPLSVQIFSPDGQAKRFNQAWENLFRLNAEQGHAFNVLKDPDLNASGAVNLIRKAFEGEVVHVPPVPYTVSTEPPEIRWIGGVLYPLKNEAGEIIEVVTIHHDITEQKRAEEAMLAINQTLEQRVNERTAELSQAKIEISRALDQERELSELKSRFVSMVSHEFRTPLGIIMSAIELMRHYEDRLSAEKRQELQMDIFSATSHMAGLMEQVLLLGRVEAGKLACKSVPCDLETLAGKLTDESLSATNRKCPVIWRAQNDLSGAHADEALLRHIFSNLIANAVKYSPEGSEVVFTARREGNDAIFQVIDCGIGIPEGDRQRLFEAFHRCGNVGDIPGTGLGLVIVKRCVDLHGGSLEIDSTVGEGTKFTIRLPLFGGELRDES